MQVRVCAGAGSIRHRSWEPFLHTGHGGWSLSNLPVSLRGSTDPSWCSTFHHPVPIRPCLSNSVQVLQAEIIRVPQSSWLHARHLPGPHQLPLQALDLSFRVWLELMFPPVDTQQKIALETKIGLWGWTDPRCCFYMRYASNHGWVLPSFVPTQPRRHQSCLAKGCAPKCSPEASQKTFSCECVEQGLTSARWMDASCFCIRIRLFANEFYTCSWESRSVMQVEELYPLGTTKFTGSLLLCNEDLPTSHALELR